MNLLIYAGIFLFKTIEEALRTLHIIVVSNGKKWLGAIVQFFVAIIWLLVTGTVIADIKEDPLKILFYALGSLLGSYIGSVIEEKIALGYVELTVETNSKSAKMLIKKLKTKKYNVKRLQGNKEDSELIIIITPRKKSNEVVKIIRLFDKESEIITETIKLISHRK
ncbi:MAG: hypothetical protein HFH47_01435 [Bacilli bacterium]|nr:hypothetical protein [Bacilli bacterium]